jgi:hypothetical protein
LPVEPLQRVDLTEAGESQLDQPLSSSESTDNGVQEKCLLFPDLTLSDLVLCRDPSPLVLLRVGVDVVEVVESKAVLTLDRAASLGRTVPRSWIELRL